MAKKEENKNDKVAAALSLIRKKFGEESVMTFDDTSIRKVDTIPSGSLKLDKALGFGWPRGRCSVVWGSYSSGKSTLCLHACANAQKMGLTVMYADMEHAFDPVYAESVGVDTKNLIFTQPDDGVECLSILKDVITQGLADLIILDSMAACLTKSELESDVNASNIGSQAKMFSLWFKQIIPSLEKNNIALICTNQARQKPGVMYGSPDVQPCGNAASFYATIMCKTSKLMSAKETDSSGDIVANTIKVHVEKNKLAPPFRTAELMVYYGKGLSVKNEIFDMAVEFGIVEKSGAWFSYKGEKIGQGAVKAKAWIDEHPDVKDEITKQVEEILMNPNEQKAAATNQLEEVVNEDGSVSTIDPNTGEVFE